MVLSILKWVGIAMVLSLIALWLWQGGFWKIADYARIIPNPLEEGFEGYAASLPGESMLPGQPEMWRVPNTTTGGSDAYYEQHGQADYENPQDQLYEDTGYQGTPQPHGGSSPYEGYVFLQIGGAQSSNPKDEYLVIRTGAYVQVPADLSGWSLQSALSGERVVIPLATQSFVQGSVNAVGPIVLHAGESVVVTSGPSPIGVSFRETTCTGYLAQSQDFSPALANACSRPTELLPRTAENVARYGESCIDFVERLPQCSYPTQMPSQLSQACRAFLASTFSYNGCTQAYGSRTYAVGSWRAYLVSSTEFWRNSHDVIRLLDSNGLTVDTLSF